MTDFEKELQAYAADYKAVWSKAKPSDLEHDVWLIRETANWARKWLMENSIGERRLKEEIAKNAELHEEIKHLKMWQRVDKFDLKTINHFLEKEAELQAKAIDKLMGSMRRIETWACEEAAYQPTMCIYQQANKTIKEVKALQGEDKS